VELPLELHEQLLDRLRSRWKMVLSEGESR